MKIKKITFLYLFIVQIIFSKEILDSLGRKIEIPEKVERVISTVPSNTEIIVDMGLEKLLIGVDKYSEKISPTLVGKGFFDVNDLNEELIIELMPDLVIASEHNLKKGKAKLDIFEQLNIPVYIIKTPSRIDEISESIDVIGEVLNENKKADELKQNFLNKIEKFKNISKETDIKQKVYFEVLENPIYSAGGKTFINDAIEIAGGENIFNNEEGWLMPSLEDIIYRNPNIIIISNEREFLLDRIRNRIEWQEIDAIKNNKIYLIDESINRPSPRIIKSIKEMYDKFK